MSVVSDFLVIVIPSGLIPAAWRAVVRLLTPEKPRRPMIVYAKKPPRRTRRKRPQATKLIPAIVVARSLSVEVPP